MSPMSPTDPHRTASGQPIASVHVCDFTSVLASTRSVRRASGGLTRVPGARFAKVRTCFGTRGSAGFPLYGLPEVRRVVAILVWEEESALEEFTLWESEQAMQRFAYGQPPGDHRETIRRNQRRSVLIEQLSARFAPLRIEGSRDPASTPNAAALQRLARMLDNARRTAV
jgi:hypothetical protein